MNTLQLVQDLIAMQEEIATEGLRPGACWIEIYTFDAKAYAGSVESVTNTYGHPRKEISRHYDHAPTATTARDLAGIDADNLRAVQRLLDVVRPNRVGRDLNRLIINELASREPF
jgi:hypothetical protein